MDAGAQCFTNPSSHALVTTLRRWPEEKIRPREVRGPASPATRLRSGAGHFSTRPRSEPAHPQAPSSKDQKAATLSLVGEPTPRSPRALHQPQPDLQHWPSAGPISIPVPAGSGSSSLFLAGVSMRLCMQTQYFKSKANIKHTLNVLIH